MRKVQFTETVLRDANQSLMATRLPYADYADILPTMDKAGYLIPLSAGAVRPLTPVCGI